MPVFLRLPERESGMDDTLYSNLKKYLSNVPRKSKKERGAVPAIGNRAPVSLRLIHRR
jgi:hypothetical protein